MIYIFFSREIVVYSINSGPVVFWVLCLWRSLTRHVDPQKENQNLPPPQDYVTHLNYFLGETFKLTFGVKTGY